MQNIKSQKNIYAYIIISLIVLLNSNFVSFAFAQEQNNRFQINLDKETIAKGYTVANPDNSLKLSLVPGILSEDTGVEIEEIDQMDMPWQADRVSRILQFEFKNKKAYDVSRPFYIQFKYDKSSKGLKQVFFFDKNFSSWRPLPTKDFPNEKFVRSLIHLPYARIAVFDMPEILTSGDASWYSYKKGNFAASPDFPRGSRLRVSNPANGKFVDVEINDFGPNRKLHPTRVVDLEKHAFSQIASTGEGVIDVNVSPLYVPLQNGRFLGIPTQGISHKPNLTVKSALVMDEDTGKVILSKNATTTLPLASLTKLVAIKVFLDMRPTLTNVIAYSVKDEEYNYKYVDYKWEVALLKVDDGETMTMEDFLYSALVGSANNAVETLVRNSGLSREEFIARMNEMVKSWGTISTKFVEPTGLAPENVSSASDYAIITKEVFKNPVIQKASIMKEYKFTTINTKESHRIKNTNYLINGVNFEVTGSKTGYLHEAGYCLMTRVKNGKGNLIVVTFNAPTRTASFNETEELIKYGLKKIHD